MSNAAPTSGELTAGHRVVALACATTSYVRSKHRYMAAIYCVIFLVQFRCITCEYVYSTGLRRVGFQSNALIADACCADVNVVTINTAYAYDTK